MKGRIKKSLSYALVGCLAIGLMLMVTAAGGGFPIKSNPFIDNLKQKLSAFTGHKPEDRVYLQFGQAVL